MSALSSLDTRSKVLVGALVAALLLLVLRFTLFAGGTPEEELLSTGAPAPAVAAAAAVPVVPVVPEVDSAAPDPLAGAAPKDPFRALAGAGAPAVDVPVVQAPVPAVDPLAPLPGTDVPVAEVPVPDVPAVEVPAGGPAIEQPPAPGEQTPADVVLALTGVEQEDGKTVAVFDLGGTAHRATVGEAFAGLTVKALQEGPHPGQWTAVVQAAAGDPFDVVTGTPHTL